MPGIRAKMHQIHDSRPSAGAYTALPRPLVWVWDLLWGRGKWRIENRKGDGSSSAICSEGANGVRNGEECLPLKKDKGPGGSLTALPAGFRAEPSPQPQTYFWLLKCIVTKLGGGRSPTPPLFLSLCIAYLPCICCIYLRDAHAPLKWWSQPNDTRVGLLLNLWGAQN